MTTLAPPLAFDTARDLAALPALALRVRERILHLATGGGCFVGASLSCADLLVHLYTRVLQVTPGTLTDPGRDYLFLSKGHDVPALYATFVELGFLAPARLSDHLSTRDSIYWHPNRAVPGVEFHSGSLGHLLSVALGVAYDIRLRGGTNRVFVVLGDGELDEGSIWEACLVASALQLDNLIAVVDRNEFQANVRTEELIPLEPLPAKFRAFGWACRTVDGHCFERLEEAFADLPAEPGRPTVVVARTVRGKGCPSLEARADRWFVDLQPEELAACLTELHGGSFGDVAIEGRVVR
ncbi:MAG TPA: 1-deoxy-D-xylulose-5-phosphate synthase N-terminal domain-containing protein [Thermoanaerobaculia bacterium]|nr:1-deoxy-D-xylulose-5-phosphate synthase N-terminal domain-containing protein [Thermoanaerobaculia bacterium]